jgi:hypothetical protein
MAIHAHALDLINDLAAILAVFLRTRLCDFAPHVLEEVFGKTLLLRHVEVLYELVVEWSSQIECSCV